MDVFLTVLSAAGGTAGAEPEPAAPPCAHSLKPLARTIGCAGPAARRPAAGLQAWTRLHEVLNLELDGHLAATGVDPALLYQAERTSWSVH